MAHILLQHSETDHLWHHCVSVCQLYNWLVRVAVMDSLTPSAKISLFLQSFTHFFLPSFCLPPFLFYSSSFISPSLCMSLCCICLVSLLLQLIESSVPPSVSCNPTVHWASATQISCGFEFWSCCVLTIILAMSRSLSPSLVLFHSLTELPSTLIQTASCTCYTWHWHSQFLALIFCHISTQIDPQSFSSDPAFSLSPTFFSYLFFT